MFQFTFERAKRDTKHIIDVGMFENFLLESILSLELF